jgi:hypothetical protein
VGGSGQREASTKSSTTKVCTTVPDHPLGRSKAPKISERVEMVGRERNCSGPIPNHPSRPAPGWLPHPPQQGIFSSPGKVSCLPGSPPPSPASIHLPPVLLPTSTLLSSILTLVVLLGCFSQDSAHYTPHLSGF